MKLKEWNSLDEETRRKIAEVIFAWEGEYKINSMSLIWRHNIDDEHRKLLKGVDIRDDGAHFKFINKMIF